MKLVHVLTLAAVVLLPGCGEKTSRLDVYGKITMDGELVETGVITFKPLEGTKAPLVGVEFSHGKYDLSGGNGPPEGKYRVEIRSPKKTEKQVVVYKGAPPGYESVETIPAVYNTKSTLTVEVSQKNREHNFDLVSGSGDAAGKKK
jgi:hypothetical protein